MFPFDDIIMVTETETRVTDISVDDEAPGVTRTSAAIMLSAYKSQVLVLHAYKIQ